MSNETTRGSAPGDRTDPLKNEPTSSPQEYPTRCEPLGSSLVSEEMRATLLAKLGGRDVLRYVGKVLHSWWVPAGVGIGHQTGVIRPDHGEGHAELTCETCSATWVGISGAPCSKCIGRIERTRQDQADRILSAEVDPDDDNAMKAWAERLAVAVEAEIVGRDEARREWRRRIALRARRAA